MKRAAAIAILVCGGCRPAPATTTAVQPRAAPSSRVPNPPADVTRAVVRLATDETTEGRIHAELRFEGALARTTVLRFAPSHEVRLEGLVVRDGEGTIETTAVAGDATRYALSRSASGALDLRYSVVLPTIEPDSFDMGLAEPIELRSSGEDTLVLPELPDDPAFSLEIHLRTGGSSIAAASSFGVGLEQHATAHLYDLRHAYFLAGDVGSAVFHASDGNDIGAWLGHTAFDPRWVSAETAGIRSLVDMWVGRHASDLAPPLTYLFSSAKRDEIPVAVVPRTRGLLVSVDRRAVWNAPARILVAQALTKRYIGSFLSIGARDGAGRFFSEGFSRAIAREILFDGTMLDPIERAAELNALLTTVAFSEEALPRATANGALVATALDVALRARNKDLQAFVRELLAKSASENRSEMPRAELMTLIGERTSEPTAKALARGLDNGDEVVLPANLAGPCFRLVTKPLVPFELGFVTSPGEQLVVTSVKKGSRAEAAGVRLGDVVTDLRYSAGKPDVPVVLSLTRGPGKPLRVRFLPAGTPKPGRVFERLQGIPNDRC